MNFHFENRLGFLAAGGPTPAARAGLGPPLADFQRSVADKSEEITAPLMMPPYAQPLQQQQNTSTIARIIIQVQLSSKMWHKQLLFIYVVPPWSSFGGLRRLIISYAIAVRFANKTLTFFGKKIYLLSYFTRL